ncbi:hypothetical protein UN63_04240 [Oceanisphaera arctica]|uniref:cyclic-guanylate-specific phosphodiesterase n=2 Tax=Oceanisphaera arctica TaxID=641510 RepID=A0A2P5TPF2_9GAMM|nr:hypothetical protein UN63_04240 [Oceanisphaera arctica]
MLMALLPAFLLLAVALLTLTYNSTSKMVDESVHHQLQETHHRLQSRLDSYLNGLDNLLSTAAEQAVLAAIISSDDRQAARTQLQKTLDNSHGEYLDLLILTRQGQYWVNMNSPLYMLEHRLPSLIADTPFFNKWSSIELEPSPSPLTALIQRYPVLSPDSGQITGSLFGGLVLNDNLTLLSLLGQELENINVQLVLRGKPVGPPLINSDIPSDLFTQVLSSQRLQGQIQGHYFSLQPLLINGEQSELQLLLLTNDAMFQQLQQTYGYHTLLALLLVLSTALALSLYTLRLISSPLASLTLFAEQVSRGHSVSFQPDCIEEFNLLGTSLEQAEKSLRLHRLVLENMMEAVVIFDRAHHLIYVNHAYTKITGQSLDEIAGQTPYRTLHLESGDTSLQLPWQTVNATGFWQGEISGRIRNGSPSPLWLSITSLRDTDNEISHYVVVFSDISILKDTQQQLQRMAHYDPLTGLANRSLFNELLDHNLSRAARHDTSLTMLFIDLDKFKHINDSLGHAAGDELLKAAARRIQHHSRTEDILCRFGGDEFILVLTSPLSHQQAMCAAQRLVNAFSDKPFRIQGQYRYVSISIGLACYPEHGRDQETLMKNADTALYQAKEQGRNQVQIFDAGMNLQTQIQIKKTTELRIALEQGQMELHYQPQFCLRDGSLVGVEALVRWNKPGIGLVYPGDFIPLAETTGIIVPMGKWVLKEACHQLSAWRQAGFNNIRMAVNLSARQLRQPSLASDIAGILQQQEMNADMLELEITESMLMEDMNTAITTMSELNQLGIHLAIDDFGTGYSSLAYLKNFPVRRLKIDKSFVQDLTADTEDTAIISAIINLAHNMGIAVIAEGIENEAQLEYLRQLNCDEGQGYFLARPMPAADMDKLLQESCPLVEKDQ